MFKTIMVPLDGSALGEKALDPALELARSYGASLLLVRASTCFDRLVPAPAPAPDTGLDLQQLEAIERDAIEEYLHEVVGSVKEQGVPIESAVVRGIEGVLDEAEQRGVDLVVISSHGRSGWRRWWSGSVAEKIIRHAHCPVLVLRPPKSL